MGPFRALLCILGPYINSMSFTSNISIITSQERVDRLTQDENYFDRWVIENYLNGDHITVTRGHSGNGGVSDLLYTNYMCYKV